MLDQLRVAGVYTDLTEVSSYTNVRLQQTIEGEFSGIMNTRVKKLLMIFTGICFGSVAWLGWNYIAEGDNACDDTVLQKSFRPDQQLEAVVFTRSCGIFTTGLATQVAIVPKGSDTAKAHAIAYVARTEYSSPDGEKIPVVMVRWMNNHTLLVKSIPNKAFVTVLEANNQVRVSRGWFQTDLVKIKYSDEPDHHDLSRK